MSNFRSRKKKNSKNLIVRFLPLIFRVIFFAFLIFITEYYHKLALFPYWKPVSIIVLVGFILYPLLFFRWYKKRKKHPDKNTKYYDYVFYRKWVFPFIVQVSIGFFGIIVSFYGLKMAVEQGFLVDLWWSMILGFMVIIFIFGSLFIHFLMLRKMEVGISNANSI